MTKKQSKKALKEKLRNLSSMSFEPIPATWDEELAHEIEAIRLKNEIPIEYNLSEQLSQLPIALAGFFDTKKQIPSTKEEHQYLDAFIHNSEELIELLNMCGSIIQSKIARNTENSRLSL